jgi:glyoxylate/hydroxypyruvate reductase A
MSACQVLVWVDDARPYEEAIERRGIAGRVQLHALARAQQPPRELLDGAEVLLAWDAPAGLLARMRSLRWLQAQTVGAEGWLARPDLRNDIVLTVARGTHRVQMPETILGALFWITKPFRHAMADQAHARWTRRMGEPLAGKTLCIVGLGTIGSELARKAQALELRVIGVARRTVAVPHVDTIYTSAEAEQAFAQADFVVLVIPQTPENENFMNAPRLAAMRPDAWLLNFARGAAVDDNALIAALNAKAIGGAILDVFREEPLPEHNPLWRTPGVLVLPHVGGLHPRRDELVAELFAANLEHWLDGKPLQGTVDRERGY